MRSLNGKHESELAFGNVDGESVLAQLFALEVALELDAMDAVVGLTGPYEGMIPDSIAIVDSNYDLNQVGV